MILTHTNSYCLGMGQNIAQALRKRNNFTRRMRIRKALLVRVMEFSMAYPKSTVACYESCAFSINKSAHLAFRGSERVDQALSRPV